MNALNFSHASADDWPAIAVLLETNAQPRAGAQAHLDHFIVARDGSQLLGCVGLEVYADAALLRSLSVAPTRQGTGVGRALLQAAIDRATALGVRELYLLTSSAADYFPRFGFRRIVRDEAPATLKASAEFQGACPASAVLMALSLQPQAALRLRSATADDAEAIAAIYGPVVAETTISFELDPPSAAEMRQRIVRTVARLPWLVALDRQGAVCGYVYASPHRERAAYQWSVDTSAYIRADSRGRGIGRALYAALFDQLIRLGYVQAFAGIALPNAASVGLHEAIGFEAIGVYRKVGFKHGAWHDVGWWQKTLQAPPDQPVPPRCDRAV